MRDRYVYGYSPSKYGDPLRGLPCRNAVSPDPALPPELILAISASFFRRWKRLERLTREVEALRADNAKLRAKLNQASCSPGMNW
jgi:hypothetical protein